MTPFAVKRMSARPSPVTSASPGAPRIVADGAMGGEACAPAPVRMNTSDDVGATISGRLSPTTFPSATPYTTAEPRFTGHPDMSDPAWSNALTFPTPSPTTIAGAPPAVMRPITGAGGDAPPSATGHAP